MLTVAFLLYLAGRACANNLICSNQSTSTVTFRPWDDLGRYTAEICTRIKLDLTEWNVDLLYNDKAIYCNNTHHSKHPGKLHSQIILDSLEQKVKSLNCNFVCLSIYFDMIFSSCYTLKSTFYNDGNDSPPYDTYHNITNKFDIRYFEKEPRVIEFNHEKDVSIYFYTVAPSTNYVVEMCSLNKTNLNTGCPKVTENCTTSARDAEVRCSLRPVEGCYRIWLTQIAPWSNGVFKTQSIVTHNFCLQAMRDEELSGSDWTVAWACGALVAACGAALLLWRLRHGIALHKRVLRYWTQLGEESRASVRERGAPPCRHVLLVYAREGEGAAGRRVAEALRAFLRVGTGAAVHDLFAPETVAAAAAGGAPGEWVRALLARPDCRLVLLQTPALACLHPAPPAPADTDTDCTTIAMSEPLLPARAVYRVPQFGDSLAQFALRLLAHAAAAEPPPHHHHHHQHQDLPAYKKYYLTTLTELQTEVFPQVVPFQRYRLPEAGPLLLEHLAAEGEHQQQQQHTREALQQLDCAVQEFVLHVRNNPEYLLEELVFT